MAGAAGFGCGFLFAFDGMLTEERFDYLIEGIPGWIAEGEAQMVVADPAFGFAGFGEGAEDCLIERGFGSKDWLVFA